MRQADALENQITPEMIQATASFLSGFSLEYMSVDEAAETLLRLALCAREVPSEIPCRRV